MNRICSITTSQEMISTIMDIISKEHPEVFQFEVEGINFTGLKLAKIDTTTRVLINSVFMISIPDGLIL